MKNKETKDMTYKKMAWTVRNFSTLTFNIRYYPEVFTANHCAWRLVISRGEINNNMSLAIYLQSTDASSLPQGCSIWAAYGITVTNQISRNESLTYGVTFEGFEPPSHPKDDFKDLGKIEKSFVPLLEEVCLWHPSSLDCIKNKSRRFNKWTFIALGRVLQFLKNKKWKDMNEEACQQLQHLWEELEMFRLDLSWLEPLVESALNMKGYHEKIEKVKKLKQDLVVTETKMNIIKEKLAHTEQNAEMIRKELVNIEEDFEERDLDAKIGYMQKFGVDM